MGSTGLYQGSNADLLDHFGQNLSLSQNGNTLAVGSINEGSAAMGINGNQGNDAFTHASGAVYVFTRSGIDWMQQAYIKASNTNALDIFGFSTSLSDDGLTLIVGAKSEQSAADGINGNQNDNTSEKAGAAYVFTFDGRSWMQKAYIKAANSDAFAEFGHAVSLSGDGSSLAVSARRERSSATGIDGNQLDTSAPSAGAVYLY